MNGILGYLPSFGTVHAALVCVPVSTGQTVCNGVSTGFFASLGALLFIYIAIAVLGIVAAVKIVSKAGYSGWWVLISFVPIVGSVFILVFAFSTWPVTREAGDAQGPGDRPRGLWPSGRIRRRACFR